jgi:hypothetical protein
VKRILLAAAAALSGALLAAPPASVPAPVDTLVGAERAFARQSVEKGIRASFLEFFAADGLAFQPGPVVSSEELRKEPEPEGRPPVTLDWAPAFAGVAVSGDLGFTTGPYTLTDDTGKASPRHGTYFSVWRKVGGSWKVAADLGAPGKAGVAPGRTALAVAPAGYAPDAGAVPSLAEIDRAIADESAVRGENLGGGLASSRDFAWTYGRYRTNGDGGEAIGYYLRVARRLADGTFRLTAEAVGPARPVAAVKAP